MASENNILNIPRIANEDLSSHKGRAVKLTSSTNVGLCGAGEAAMGILTNDAAITKAADVCVLGSARGVAGAAFSAGDKLAANATGKLVKAVRGDQIVAVALQAASGADVTVEVFVVVGADAGELEIVTVTPGVENAAAANTWEVDCAITDIHGVAITAARAGIIVSQAETEGQGGISAKGVPVGTIAPTSAPATGNSTAGFLTTAGGLFSFRISNTAAEVNVVFIQADNCRPRVIILTFT